MGTPEARTLTEVEMEIMNAVWDGGEATVPQLCAILRRRGKPLAQSSVRTMLSILLRKGYVRRRDAARGHWYRAAVSKDRAQGRMLRSLIRRLFDGSGMSLAAAIMKDGLVSDREIAEAKRMIRDRERRSGV